MQRGEIRLVDLEPVRGSEADKRRPAVIVSNDGANLAAARLGRGVVTIVPVTSATDRVYPFQVLLRAADTGLRDDSKAQAEQVRAVARRRCRGHCARCRGGHGCECPGVRRKRACRLQQPCCRGGRGEYGEHSYRGKAKTHAARLAGNFAPARVFKERCGQTNVRPQAPTVSLGGL